MRAISLVMTLASLAFGHPADTTDTARIEGSVRSTTGELLQYAIIRLEGPAGTSAGATDQQGKFALEAVVPGSGYHLTSQRSGYMQGRYGSPSPGGRGTPLTLSAGQVLKDLIISMAPQSVITGRVTDHEGHPVEGATVVALRSVFGPGGRELMRQGSTTTDEDGNYRIAELTPGNYFLRASFKAGRCLLSEQ